jgi:hypothetical protein
MQANRNVIQRILFGVLLVLLSVFFYVVHFFVFRDAHHICWSTTGLPSSCGLYFIWPRNYLIGRK